MTDLDISLPTGIHATVLHDRDPNGQMAEAVIVWADRITDRCPQCHEPIPRVVETCPALLNGTACAGGQVEDLDQQHGCGCWLSVDWCETTLDEVAAVAATMAADRQAEIVAERDRIRRRLRGELVEAMRRLNEPLDPETPDWDAETIEDRIEEISTSSNEPGVWCEGGQWSAWDWDPGDDPGEVLIEHVEWLTTTQAADRVGRPVATFRREMSRERARGVELRAPQACWIDDRTPVYADVLVDAWRANRPGRGARTDRHTESEETPC
jgi:hypothetical protein